MLASSATAASTFSATNSTDAMDLDLAQQISQASSEGKDASGAVGFQVKGEIPLSHGNPQQARRYFEAAEHELTVLQPGRRGATSSSDYRPPDK